MGMQKKNNNPKQKNSLKKDSYSKKLSEILNVSVR